MLSKLNSNLLLLPLFTIHMDLLNTKLWKWAWGFATGTFKPVVDIATALFYAMLGLRGLSEVYNQVW